MVIHSAYKMAPEMAGQRVFISKTPKSGIFRDMAKCGECPSNAKPVSILQRKSLVPGMAQKQRQTRINTQ
jgi:hypothetical protein